MPRDYVQTDTASTSAMTNIGPPHYCTTSLNRSTNRLERRCTEGGTPGSGTVSPSIGTNLVLKFALFEILPGEGNWPAGDYTINLNVVSGNMNVVWSHVFICRVNASNVSQQTIYETAIEESISMGSAGILSLTVTGAAAASAVATDRLVIMLAARNQNTMSASAITVGTDQIITTPFSGGATTHNADGTRATTAELSATATRIQTATGTLAATGGITANADIIGGSVEHEATGTLAADAGITAVAGQVHPDSGTLDVTAGLTGDAAATLPAEATLAATANLSAEADIRPIAPVGLHLVDATDATIEIAWDPYPDAVGYDVERDGLVIATDVAAEGYLDENLDPSTEYEYRVRAVLSGGPPLGDFYTSAYQEAY